MTKAQEAAARFVETDARTNALACPSRLVTRGGPPQVQEVVAMQEYDLYINTKKPAVGMYVRKGAGLPDLRDKDDWVFDGAATEDLLPPRVVEGVATNGHAFRDMD